MKTIIKKSDQAQKVFDMRASRLVHRWSARGLGRSYIIDACGDQIASAGGCGYDRRGAAFGSFVTNLLQVELLALAKKVCKPKKRGDRWIRSDRFYGLTLDREKDRAIIDGGCGLESVQKVLGAIGFSLIWRGESRTGSGSGAEFFSLEPISKADRLLYLKR